MRALPRIAAALVLAGMLAGCVAEEVWAPDVAVSSASYQPAGGSTVTLMTMVSTRNGSGGHSGLIIDGAQRVVFDPAGSWHHPNIPERNDVLFGMSPQYMDFYMDYHARETYYVVLQEVDVSPETAASLIAAVQSYGAVPSAQCSLSISRILSQTPGFETISPAWFPTRTMERFAAIPGVRTREVYDDDSDNNLELLQAQARAAQAQQEIQALAN
jgi:hypothetical protein